MAYEAAKMPPVLDQLAWKTRSLGTCRKPKSARINGAGHRAGGFEASLLTSKRAPQS